MTFVCDEILWEWCWWDMCPICVKQSGTGGTQHVGFATRGFNGGLGGFSRQGVVSEWGAVLGAKPQGLVNAWGGTMFYDVLTRGWMGGWSGNWPEGWCIAWVGSAHARRLFALMHQVWWMG